MVTSTWDREVAGSNPAPGCKARVAQRESTNVPFPPLLLSYIINGAAQVKDTSLVKKNFNRLLLPV